MMLSECPPMTIVHSTAERLRDVKIVNRENVNERYPESLPNDSSALATCLKKKPAPSDVSEAPQRVQRTPHIKYGDSVNIITFVDVHHVYVRNVQDDTVEFNSLKKSIHWYCSAAKPIRFTPQLNQIVGAKCGTNRLYYRARILKKISQFKYNVHFIDYGHQEHVYSSNMVSLPSKFVENPSKITLVKLKDVQLCKLNKNACAYVDLISENETITIDYIEEDTNSVVLKTSSNQNINSHLNSLILGNHKNPVTTGKDKSEEEPETENVSETGGLLNVNGSSKLKYGVHDIIKPPSSEQNVVHGAGETSSVGTMTESPAPPAKFSVGTMTESFVPPAMTRWKRFKKSLRRFVRRCTVC